MLVIPFGGYIVQTKYTRGQSKKFHAGTIKGHCTAKFVARLLGGIRIRPCIIPTFSSPRTMQKNLQSIKKQTLTMCSPCVWGVTTMQKERRVQAMRVIDVDDLGVGRCSKDVLPAAYCAGWNGLLGLIEKAPTVDAVPVVRCKDCKHKGWVQEPCHGKSVDYCRVWDCTLRNLESTFCSYGEPKEGANADNHD